MSLVRSRQRPFPQHWEILSFDDAFHDMTGGNVKIQTPDYLNDGVLPVIDQGQQEVAGYVDDIALACRAPLPCILFGDHTRIFKYANQPFALGADGVKVLAPRSGLDPRFALHFLRTVQLPEDLGYSRHYKYLRQAMVPCPPFPEQRRIADILDKADTIRRKRKEAIAFTEELLRSAFLEMFGDPVTNPKSWPVKPLGELVEIRGGGTPSRARAEFFAGQIPWATAKDFRADVVLDTEEHVSEEALVGSATKLVPPGSILIVVKSKILMRRLPVAVAGVPLCFNQDVKALVLRDAADGPYIATHIRLAQRQLLELARGVNTEGLTLVHLRGHSVMQPPRSMVRAFATLEMKARSALMRMTVGTSDADILFSSLVARAFSGSSEASRAFEAAC